jgi:cell division protease FtsH
MKKRNIRIFYIFTALCLGICGMYIFFNESAVSGKQNHTVPYKNFYEAVSAGTIATAKISKSGILFTRTDAETSFVTENPDSPDLKEFLLRNGVRVVESNDPGSMFSSVMDVSFYILFFSVLIFVFRKFISPQTFRVVRKTGVTFDDVVGMESLKSDMVQVIDIMQHPAAYRKQGMRMPKGILLEGAPGNGKTLFAKALAGESRVNFIPAKATDFESMFMAIGPLKVKLLFRKARKQAPCIIFIDEFDGIGTRRNYSGSAIETENTRIVTALLNELDGFEPMSGILVLAATNSITALDPALIRPGRFDVRVAVPYPDEKDRRQLVALYMKNKAYCDECSESALASLFSGFSCARIESVLNRAALIAAQSGSGKFSLADVRTAVNELKEI